MKLIAIVGATASGKSDLALRLALEHNAYILSIDSLSIYKEIDIASAKPSIDELSSVKHFGVNTIFPNESFDVTDIVNYYYSAKKEALENSKNLIIVGGSSFFLKTLLSGLSTIPSFSADTIEKTKELLRDPEATHAMLSKIDPKKMEKIEPQDKYRIEKVALLYVESGRGATEWFELHPPTPIIDSLEVYNIDIERSLLRDRIKLRSQKMIELGLVNEVKELEAKYGRDHNSMRAIGIKEVLNFFDGIYSEKEMLERIIIHTSQLAKRQTTFNRHQFENSKTLSVENIFINASSYLT
ncbi:MAG: tRNA (adenosine(37)-N6)-dimethylallyltransferase MiaA [Helicobacteraceae bacterium]|nr:tRNA (adenosine(37)-N6)-dimethylallyltransferase MiaA [Helicobacteraceae bacterium]